MTRLILSPGTAQARQVILKPGVNNVGRSAANDVTIEDGSVSGSHCQLILADGTLRIRDVGSTNGTFVNGAPVSEANLEAGQHIQLGSVQLMFEADDPSASTDVASAALANPAPRTARLRIALEPGGPAPSAVTEPVLTPDEGPCITGFQAPVTTQCKYHPRTPARWACAACHKSYCDLCVTARAGQNYCRTCAAVCEPLHVTFEAPRQQTFFSELPRAVIYPFRGKGVMMLIGATILFAALDFLSGGLAGIFIKMAALGYLFAYVQNIIHTTAAGDDRLPDLPAMDGLFGNFFRLTGTVLMSFGPALVAAYFAIWQEQPAAGIALIPTIVFGCLYFPMAFLAVAIKDNVLAGNPLVVVPSILKVPLEYLVTAILLAGVFGVRWLGDAVSGEMGGKALRTESMSVMFLLFGLRIIWAFLSVYLLTVTMRILGVLYLTRREKLGW